MSTTPLISVIIPVYNAEDTLRQCVESVRGQQGARLEILLVDDGSDTACAELVGQLANEDERIAAFHLKESGVSAARNVGLEHAKGDYIAFVDADDTILPGYLSALLQALQSSGADIAGCAFKSCADRTQMMENVPDIPDTDMQVRLYKGEQIIPERILRLDTRIWSKLFTRECIGTHRFDTDLTIGEDMLFFLESLQRDSVYAVIRAPLYRYWVNPKGAMEKPFEPSFMDQILCWDKAERYIHAQFPELLAAGDTAAMLAGTQAVSAVLTASRIGRLSAAQQRQYTEYKKVCRKSLQRACSVHGWNRWIFSGYGFKSFLLRYFPGIFYRIF